MADDEDYDIMPHKEIIRIKKELEELKNAKDTTETKNIVHQINLLKTSIEDLLAIFKEAQEGFKLEEKEPDYIKNVMNRLETISEQNTRIAEGIVAVADMINELRFKMDKQVIERPRPKPFEMQQPQPGFGQQQQRSMPMPPPPSLDMDFNIPPPPNFDIPPPPDFGEPPRKKGLFGFKK